MFYFSPGPSQLFPTVQKHLMDAMDLQLGSISHRGKQFENIFSETVENLRSVLGFPSDYKVFFLGSATETWERLIQNCVEKTSFHLVNGSFSDKFREISSTMGRNALSYKAEEGKGFDIHKIEIPEEAELVAAIMNETSTGVAMPNEDLVLLREKCKNKILAVDVVTAVPGMSIDFSKTDCAYFSVQKGFGMPAGMGVAIVSPKAIERAKELKAKGISIGTYHSFPSFEKYFLQNQTPSTPNVLYIYLLGKIAGEMLQYGVEKIKSETKYKAGLLYDLFEKHSSLSPFVEEKRIRSETICVANVNGGSSNLIAALKEKGVTVGSGYGPFKEKQIRIANFPAHDIETVERFVSKMSS